jgi:putative MATE family efflux protein
MIVQTGTVVINIVLAPILIFGWGTGYRMGVSGAALATFIAIAAGLIWISLYFIDEKAYLRFRFSDWGPKIGVWWQMLRIGLPAGAEFALMSLYLVIVYAIAKPFGSVAQAGFGIGFRIVQSAFLPVVALGFAVAPVAGQNFGAKQAQRVKEAFKAAASIAAGAMLVTGLFVYLLAPRLVGIFSTDAEVIRVGVEYLRVVAFSFVFSGVTFVTSSMFQAMGNTIPSLATSTLRVFVSILPVLILARRPGFELRWI